MAFKFPSDEWVKEFASQINGSKAYEESGKDWEGDWIFIVEADDAFPNTVYFFIGLYHGKVTDAAMIESEHARDASTLCAVPLPPGARPLKGSWTRFKG